NELADNVARRLQRKQAAGRTVQLMLRYHDRKTMTRRKKLNAYIDTKQDILEIANELLQTHWNLEPLRLLGITLQVVEEKRHIAHQLDLFTYETEETMENLHTVVDNYSQMYGTYHYKNVEEKRQMAHILELFNYEKDAKKEELHSVVDNLPQKYGKDLYKNVKRMTSYEQPRTILQ